MRIFVFLIAACIISSCNMITGSGRITSEKRTVAPFHEIESSGSLKVEVTPGVSTSVEVEADDNVISHIITSVKDGRLIVRLEDGGYTNIHAVIYVTAPLITKLITSGSGSLTTKGKLINTDKMELIATGSGSISADVHSPEVYAEVHGSGSIEATGRTKLFTASNTGSGSIKCSGLLSESANVKTSGSGSTHVFASVQLDAELNGSGDIEYRGNPKTKNVQDNGSGDIAEKSN